MEIELKLNHVVPVDSTAGRGNLVLRHFVAHFPLNSVAIK